MSKCGANARPTGIKASECFELSLKTGLFLKNIDEFQVVNLNNKQWVQEKINAGDIVVATEFHNPEDTSTEPNLYEDGDLSVYTSLGNKKLKAELHTTTCGHQALLSYVDAGFEQFIPITEDGKAGVIYDGNEYGFIKGQSIGKILVSMRKMASKDKAPTSEVIISFKDYSEFDKHGLYVDLDYNVMLDLESVSVLRGVYSDIINLDPNVDVRAAILINNSCLHLTEDDINNLDLEFVDKDFITSNVTTITVNNTGLTIELQLESDTLPANFGQNGGVYIRTKIGGDDYGVQNGLFLNTKTWKPYQQQQQ